jgi:hypothetical protein
MPGEHRAGLDNIDFLPLENETFGQSSPEQRYIQEHLLNVTSGNPADSTMQLSDTMSSRMVDEIYAAASTIIHRNPSMGN